MVYFLLIPEELSLGGSLTIIHEKEPIGIRSKLRTVSSISEYVIISSLFIDL